MKFSCLSVWGVVGVCLVCVCVGGVGVWGCVCVCFFFVYFQVFHEVMISFRIFRYSKRFYIV